MTARYYLATIPDAGECELDGSEAHHLLHVMRAKAGGSIDLFDGNGRVAQAIIVKTSRKSATLSIQQVEDVERPWDLRLHLGVALPKGDRQKWLVEKCVELGVASLTPLVTEFSVAQPNDKARARLERAGIEACKQCGRSHAMTIHAPIAWQPWIEQASNLWIAHPYIEGDETLSTAADFIDRNIGAAAIYAGIGPEGGLSPSEVTFACQTGRSLSLGPRILRIETAAAVLATLSNVTQAAAPNGSPNE